MRVRTKWYLWSCRVQSQGDVEFHLSRRTKWQKWVDNKLTGVWCRIKNSHNRRRKYREFSEWPDWLGTMLKNHMKEVRESERTPWDRWAKSGARKKPIGNSGMRKVTRDGLVRKLKQQSWKCCLTGKDLEPETAQMDHIVPLSRGGVHGMENIQILHKDVNRAKNTMTNEEFIELCREVVRGSEAGVPVETMNAEKTLFDGIGE